MPSLGCDFETFSEIDLKKAGLHNYATHPSTGIHCMSYGPDPTHIKTWVEGEAFPQDLQDHIDQGGILTAWNAAFELALWNLCAVRKYGWKPLPISQVRCSMVRAYAMALPGALEDAAPALGVDQRKDAEGEATQAESVYRYLTGPRFKSRIEASIEAWTAMQADLEAERRAMTRSWAKRAAQIDAVMNSTAGLFGDLQATATLPEIAALSMAALGSGSL